MTDNIPSSFSSFELSITSGIEALRFIFRQAQCRMATEDDFAEAEKILDDFGNYIPRLYKDYVRITNEQLQLNAQAEELHNMLNGLNHEDKLDEFSEVISKEIHEALKEANLEVRMVQAAAGETPAK